MTSRNEFLVQHFANWRDSPIADPSNPFRFNICAGPAFAFFVQRRSMLKIRRSANGDIVFTVSGRLEADNVSELAALFAAEPPGRALVLDLKDVVLVDRDVIRFLRARQGDGISLRNCPPYIREWIAREAEQP